MPFCKLQSQKIPQGKSENVEYSRQIMAKEFAGNPQAINFLKQHGRKLCPLAAR